MSIPSRMATRHYWSTSRRQPNQAIFHLPWQSERAVGRIDRAQRVTVSVCDRYTSAKKIMQHRLRLIYRINCLSFGWSRPQAKVSAIPLVNRSRCCIFTPLLFSSPLYLVVSPLLSLAPPLT